MYEKHTWETGEVITAEKLNNIEEGIDESVVIFSSTFSGSSGSNKYYFDLDITEDKLNDINTKLLNNSHLIIGVDYAFSGQPSNIKTRQYFTDYHYSYDSDSNIFSITGYLVTSAADRAQAGFEHQVVTIWITNDNNATEDGEFKPNTFIRDTIYS